MRVSILLQITDGDGIATPAEEIAVLVSVQEHLERLYSSMV
jgi:hypothetical protein